MPPEQQKPTSELDGFKKVMNEMLALKTAKSGDYGNSWKAAGINGLNMQIYRKFTRIWINKNKDAKDINCEMLRDSYMDLAVYAIMAIQLIDAGETEDQILRVLTGLTDK